MKKFSLYHKFLPIKQVALQSTLHWCVVHCSKNMHASYGAVVTVHVAGDDCRYDLRLLSQGCFALVRLTDCIRTIGLEFQTGYTSMSSYGPDDCPAAWLLDKLNMREATEMPLISELDYSVASSLKSVTLVYNIPQRVIEAGSLIVHEYLSATNRSVAQPLLNKVYADVVAKLHRPVTTENSVNPVEQFMAVQYVNRAMVSAPYHFGAMLTPMSVEYVDADMQ